MQIVITTITPTIPIAFFNIAEHPITVSTASPSTLPTTGIKVEIAALAVFAVIPSTLLPSVPSIDRTPTNIVSSMPIIQIELDFKNLDNLFICILSDILEIIDNAVLTRIIGIIIVWNIFEIKFIINNIIGCTKFTDTTLPEASINVIRRGNNNCINEIIFATASLVRVIILEKLLIITVAIKIY